MDHLPEALLGILGVVLTALITAFKDEIGLLFTGKLGANRDLEGRWACTWHSRPFPSAAGPPTVISDVVKIDKVSGDRIKATGESPGAGRYRLSGRMLRSMVLTFSWSGDGPRQFLGGVAILELNTARTKLTGYWSEVTEDRTFIGGEVTWTKQSSSR